jgi:hypothetical protein
MMTIEDYDGKLDIMSGASLHELWKYCERVRDILASDLTEFRMSCAHGTIMGLCCKELSSSQIPCWLDQYIESIGNPQTYLILPNSTLPWRATLRTWLDSLAANARPYPVSLYKNFGKLWGLLSMAVSKVL